MLYPDNPQIVDWLGIGPTLKSEPAIAVVVVVFAIAFLWAVLQLRGSAHARLARELEAASEPTARDARRGARDRPGRLTRARPLGRHGRGRRDRAPRRRGPRRPGGRRRHDAHLVAPSDDGRARADRMVPPAARRALRSGADRSASLTGERGGRLDRLDLWFLVVLVLATMTLRTFRLAEPYQMHFDEVYHARTATEFLQ